MRKKRFLAVTLAASMVLGSSVSAFAASFPYPTTNVTNENQASGNMTGNMSFEGTVSEDVFSVDLPTETYNASVFDFILDPQELIKETKGIRYDKNSGITGGTPAASKQITSASENITEWGTLYFVNYISNNANPMGPSANRLSASSDALTVVNKSSMDVDVSLTATVSGMDSLDVVSSNSDISSNENPSIYLALQGSASSNVATVQAKEAIGKTKGASIKTCVSGNDGAYVISVNKSNGKYVKVPSSNSSEYSQYSFSLTGACGGGTVKDWQEKESALVQAAPKVKVTWNIAPHSNVPANRAPSAEHSVYTITPGTPQAVVIDLGAGALAATGISKITFFNNQNVKTELQTIYYEINGNTVTFKGNATNLIQAAREYTIVMDNDAEVKVTLQP